MANPYEAPSAGLEGNSIDQMVLCVGCSKELHITASTCPSCGASQRKRAYKSKTVAAVLAFLLGGLGIHRFYLGQWWGIFYLLFFWTWIPGLIAFVEFIVFLVSDNHKWDQKYNEGKPAAVGEGAGGGTWVLVIVGIFAFIAIIGILAAIALPAYHDYTLRTKVVMAVTEAQQVQRQADAFYQNNQRLPLNNLELDLEEPYVLNSNNLVLVQDNIIQLQVQDTSELINGKTIVFRPQFNGDSINWSCTGGNLESKYRPAACR